MNEISSKLDRTADQVKNRIQDIGKQATGTDTLSRVKAAGSDLIDRARSAADDLDIRRTWDDLRGKAMDFTKDHPYAVLAGALALAYLAGRARSLALGKIVENT